MKRWTGTIKTATHAFLACLLAFVVLVGSCHNGGGSFVWSESGHGDEQCSVDSIHPAHLPDLELFQSADAPSGPRLVVKAVWIPWHASIGPMSPVDPPIPRIRLAPRNQVRRASLPWSSASSVLAPYFPRSDMTV